NDKFRNPQPRSKVTVAYTRLQQINQLQQPIPFEDINTIFMNVIFRKRSGQQEQVFRGRLIPIQKMDKCSYWSQLLSRSPSALCADSSNCSLYGPRAIRAAKLPG
uniref:Uncharacterized protein n=1 Tax=Clytia hemisphaerica TaxID=252671 RepID=A0A7M5WYW2_9CNID